MSHTGNGNERYFPNQSPAGDADNNLDWLEAVPLPNIFKNVDETVIDVLKTRILSLVGNITSEADLIPESIKSDVIALNKVMRNEITQGSNKEIEEGVRGLVLAQLQRKKINWEKIEE